MIPKLSIGLNMLFAMAMMFAVCYVGSASVFDATHHVSNQQEKVTICVNRMIYIYIYSVSKAGVRFLITFSFPEIGCRSNRPRCYYVRRDVPFRHQGVQDLI